MSTCTHCLRIVKLRGECNHLHMAKVPVSRRHHHRDTMNLRIVGRRRQRDLIVRALVAALVCLALNIPPALGSSRDEGPQSQDQASLAPRHSVDTHGGPDGLQHGIITKREDSPSSEANQTTLLQCFQVAQPVLGPSGTVASDGSASVQKNSGSASQTPCQTTLMEYSFASSYGKPYVGKSAVPSLCAGRRVRSSH